MYICSWDSLSAAVDDFPMSAMLIRRCALRLAMRRQFIRCAHAVQRARDREAREEREEREERATGATSIVNGPSDGAGTFTRSKTINEMLCRSTNVSDARVSLQTNLIEMRRMSASKASVFSSSSDLVGRVCEGGGGSSGGAAPAAAAPLTRSFSVRFSDAADGEGRTREAQELSRVCRAMNETMQSLAVAVSRQEGALKRVAADVAILRNAQVAAPAAATSAPAPPRASTGDRRAPLEAILSGLSA